jgi:hypothetical protein
MPLPPLNSSIPCKGCGDDQDARRDDWRPLLPGGQPVSNNDNGEIKIEEKPAIPVGPFPAQPPRQCCGNCNAFRQTSQNGDGMCCALPPTPMIIGMGRPLIEFGGVGGVPQPVINGFFPPVNRNIWCRFWMQQGDYGSPQS